MINKSLVRSITSFQKKRTQKYRFTLVCAKTKRPDADELFDKKKS